MSIAIALNPTPYRVSAMTVCGKLSNIPNIQKLFDVGSIIPYWWIGEGILKIEVNGRQKGTCRDAILSKAESSRQFFNQWSLVFRLCINPLNNIFKEVNIKLFKKGSFQMTGITSDEMGRTTLTRLIEMNPEAFPADTTITEFNVCMMNSDYKIEPLIRRDRLYQVLIEKYGLRCSYEPTVYQGVNTKFLWNNERPKDAPPGICACPTPCEGRGSGYGEGQCKQITIAPFRTGSIIINGAHNLKQLSDVYEFFNTVLQTYAAEVLRPHAPLPLILQEKETGTSKSKGKTKAALPTTPEGILCQKMRSSPRNVVHI